MRLGRYGFRIEAAAPVAHEDRDLVLSDVDEGRDLLRAGVLRGVRHRLARGEDECFHPVVDGYVARPDELDRNAEELLDLGCGGIHGCGKPTALGSPLIGVEPGTKLTLLAACQRGHAARIAGLALDERQRLQHRVVDACSHLGTLLRADAACPLGVPLGGQPPGPRPEHEQQRDGDGARFEGCVAAVRRRVLVDEDDHADDDEREADRDRSTAAAPGQQDPGSAQRGGPDQRVREAEAAERDRARDGETHIAEQPPAQAAEPGHPLARARARHRRTRRLRHRRRRRGERT